MYQFLYHHQSSYLAIHPTDPPCLLLHPPLHLVNDIKLRKPGYLSIKQRYIVRLEMLELYDRRYPASHYRLTPESFAIVASIFSIPVDTTATKKAGYDHGEEADGTPEIKISTTHREPDSGGERPLLVAAVMETARLSHRGKPDETQFGPEFKVSTTHREPTFDGEIPPLATTKPSATPQNEPERDTAEPSSTYPGFLEGKTATASRLHPQSLTSDGVKALILGAMMKFGENLEALKTILRKDKA